MAKEEMTPEQREKAREFALKNLEDKVLQAGMASVLIKGREGEANDFGPFDYRSGYAHFMDAYESAGNTDNKKRIRAELEKKGGLYNATDGMKAQVAAGIFQSYLPNIKVSDIVELAKKLSGKDTTLAEEYKEVYLADLLKSEKGKKFVEDLMNSYNSMLAQKALEGGHKNSIVNLADNIQRLCNEEDKEEGEE